MVTMLRRICRYAHRVARRPFGLARMKLRNIHHFPPNYLYVGAFGKESVVVDVGCGFEAEFSRHVIEKYGVRALGVDPTRKHAPFLAELAKRTNGRFQHVPLAVAPRSGELTFYESRQNESGSFLTSHTNIRHDDVTAYKVEAVGLNELSRKLGVQSVAYLKLDLEGAEYGLFDGLSEEDLGPFTQIFLECHHHCTEHTFAETKQLVRVICKAGFSVFTLDRHNFLFYRPQ